MTTSHAPENPDNSDTSASQSVSDPVNLSAGNGTGHALLARRASLIILGSVLDKKQPLDTVLEINPDFKSLDSRDRGFVRMLVTTTLRRLGEIDKRIRRAQDRPDQSLQPVLKNILRLGMAQILFLNVPDHAAVDTSVQLAEKQGLAKFKGLVNGILRNLIRHNEQWAEHIDPAGDNIPDWLLEMWENEYGQEAARTAALACLAEPPLDMTVKSDDRIQDVADKLGGTVLWNGTIRLQTGTGQIQNLDEYQDGSWWVQDVSAALPVSLLGDITGKDVIDLCAAPGGKTAQLAARGAHVQALDRSARRLERFMDNMRRLRLEKNVLPVSADASVWSPKDPVDIVLLDAPCSATGTIRRNPDILHLKSERDVYKMNGVQRTLMKNAASMLKSGGILIFCTCSIQKEEGEDQLDWFLSTDAPFRRVPIAPDEVGGQDYLLNDEGDIRILPHMMGEQGGMDGFFIARLVRV